MDFPQDNNFGGTAMLDYQTVLSAANELTIVEKVQLIEALWDTVPETDLPSLSDEWIAEIKQRSDEYDAGQVKTVPWETVQAEALRRIGNNVTD
jgi:putative addiction module component (TIGR02574 family)